MKFQQLQKAFTLIEVMIIVAIISILAATTIPIYYQYISKARQSACLSEAKAYSNNVLYALNDDDSSTFPMSPVTSTCRSITDATGWTLDTQQKIFAIANFSSDALIECDIPNGSSCRVLP